MNEQSERAPRVYPEDRYRLTAEAALERSTVVSGQLVLLPNLKEVVTAMGTTNGSVVRTKTYPEIIEEQTGLTIVHNGLVGMKTEEDPKASIEDLASRLPIEDVRHLVNRLLSRLVKED